MIDGVQEWVGLRVLGQEGIGARVWCGLVLLVLLCVAGSWCGAVGGASCRQQAHVGCNGCGDSNGNVGVASGSSRQQLAGTVDWVEVGCSTGAGGCGEAADSSG